MAIAGNAEPSFEARIEGGRLILNRQALRIGVISDPAIAVDRMREGHVIFLDAHSNIVDEVVQLVEGDKYG